MFDMRKVKIDMILMMIIFLLIPMNLFFVLIGNRLSLHFEGTVNIPVWFYLLFNTVILGLLMMTIRRVKLPIEKMMSAYARFQNSSKPSKIAISSKDDLKKLYEKYNTFIDQHLLEMEDLKVTIVKTKEEIDENRAGIEKAEKECDTLKHINTNLVILERRATEIKRIATTSKEKTDDSFKEKLTYKTKELEFLREINSAMSNETNIDHLLVVIAQKLNALLTINACTIRILNKEGLLELKSVAGAYQHLVRKAVVDPMNDSAGEAMEKNRILIIKNPEQGNLQHYEELSHLAKVSSEFVIVPLENNGRQLGIISVAFSDKVKDSDLKVLSSFGQQASIAIDKSSLYETLKDEYLNTIKALITAIEEKDQYTEGHSERVAKYACLIGESIGLTDEQLDELEIAGLLHDIGKIGIQDKILTKPGKLTDFEFEQIKQHPNIGYRIVEPIGLSQNIMDGILLHHKKVDLSGYPVEIDIMDMPVTAKIIGIADAFDAMTSNRSYTIKKDTKSAFEELIRCGNIQFDKNIVDAFHQILIHYPERIEEIKNGGSNVLYSAI